MPRLARLVIPEVAMHVMRRGHDRKDCYAYCLMRNLDSGTSNTSTAAMIAAARYGSEPQLDSLTAALDL